MRVLLRLAIITQLAAGLGHAEGVAAYPAAGAAGTDARAFMIGWKFSVSSQVTVTALAFLDVTGRGLNVAHTVGIFDANTSQVLVSATVPAGAAVAYRDGFRYVPASLVLQAGTYVIGATSQSESDPVMVHSAGIQTASKITYIEERQLQTSSFTMPTVNFTLDEQGDFGPSFLIAESSPPNSVTGIANSAGGPAGFAPATYVSLFGSGLANTTRAWTQADFSGGNNLPVSLDGVSVTVGGTPAFVEFVSPGQINIITPDLPLANGGVPVVVKAPGKPDLMSWIDIRTTAPALFTWLTGTSESGRYVVAQHADYTNVGRQGLFPDKASTFTSPAKPGEVIVLYGTGFGATQPAHPSATLSDKIYPLATPASATIGGVNAPVLFGGLIPPLASVYQFNVMVPANLSNGDFPLVVTVNGVSTTVGILTIQN